MMNWIFNLQKSISKLISAGYTGSKNPVRNRLKIYFVKLGFSILIFEKSSTGRQGDCLPSKLNKKCCPKQCELSFPFFLGSIAYLKDMISASPLWCNQCSTKEICPEDQGFGNITDYQKGKLQIPSPNVSATPIRQMGLEMG